MGAHRPPLALLATVLLICLGPVGPGHAQNAPDDPRLVAQMNRICLSAALVSGGVDKYTKSFCQCAAPILLRHMTPESRTRLLVENRTDRRPDYDDPNATADEILKACPPASP